MAQNDLGLIPPQTAERLAEEKIMSLTYGRSFCLRETYSALHERLCHRESLKCHQWHLPLSLFDFP